MLDWNHSMTQGGVIVTVSDDKTILLALSNCVNIISTSRCIQGIKDEKFIPHIIHHSHPILISQFTHKICQILLTHSK